jgi:Mn-containing catalase
VLDGMMRGMQRGRPGRICVPLLGAGIVFILLGHSVAALVIVAVTTAYYFGWQRGHDVGIGFVRRWHLEHAAETLDAARRAEPRARTPRAPVRRLGRGASSLRRATDLRVGQLDGGLPVDFGGAPWTGHYVFASGVLVEDVAHNSFLETGARNGKLKVFEAVDHPAARELTGYLLVRGGVHQVAHAGALELLTGADLTKTFPMPRIQTEKIPECQPRLERGSHVTLYRFTPDGYEEVVTVFKGADPERTRSRASSTRRRRAPRGRTRPLRRTCSRDYSSDEIAEIAEIAHKLRKDAGSSEPRKTEMNLP